MAFLLSPSFNDLISLLFMFISSSQSYDIHYSEKINASIYLETLCPASADFNHGPHEIYFNTMHACAIKSYGYSVLVNISSFNHFIR
ncbi:hypothetical protein Peur_044760 [Populus x canadensis]